MKKILILNGPNLNMLGAREPEVYGTDTLADIEVLCLRAGEEFDCAISFRQSNYEGELVTWIQEACEKVDGIIINAAAYTHTSIAIYDALCLHECPVMEVHLSDINEREDFRKKSYVALRADKKIYGKGPQGYVEAVRMVNELLADKDQTVFG